MAEEVITALSLRLAVRDRLAEMCCKAVNRSLAVLPAFDRLLGIVGLPIPQLRSDPICNMTGRHTAALCNCRGAKIVPRLWNAAIGLESHEASGFKALNYRVVCAPRLAILTRDGELARAVPGCDLKDCRFVRTELQFGRQQSSRLIPA